MASGKPRFKNPPNKETQPVIQTHNENSVILVFLIMTQCEHQWAFQLFYSSMIGWIKLNAGMRYCCVK